MHLGPMHGHGMSPNFLHCMFRIRIDKPPNKWALLFFFGGKWEMTLHHELTQKIFKRCISLRGTWESLWFVFGSVFLLDGLKDDNGLAQRTDNLVYPKQSLLHSGKKPGKTQQTLSETLKRGPKFCWDVAFQLRGIGIWSILGSVF